MKKYTAIYWRSNPQLKNNGYHITETIRAKNIENATKKANSLHNHNSYGCTSLLEVKEITSESVN